MIAPTFFIIAYSILDFYTYGFCSTDANLVAKILSYVILVLYFWAFSIIINNIRATDDAIRAKEEIPFFARIIAVADSYDAMTSNRSYRQYLPQDVVRAEIEKNIGTQFDPEAARGMLSIIDEDVGYELHE